MKKFFGVIVAVMLCACLLVPTAFAVESEDPMATLTELLGDVDLGALNADEITKIMADLDLEGLDLEGLIAQFEGEEENGGALGTLDTMLQQLNSVQAENSGEGTTTAIAAIGGYDIGAIIQLIPGDFDKDAITGILGSLTSVDFTSLMGSVSTAFTGEGINLGAYDSVGSFDIATLAANADKNDAAAGATDLTAGLADTIMGALKGLGVDSATIEKLLGNDIVNFFANMYIGFIGDVEDTTKATTTSTPDTGDTSAVFVALATLAVASGAAFVCLKKKED